MTLATHNYAVKCTAVIGKLNIVYSAVLLITVKIYRTVFGLACYKMR